MQPQYNISPQTFSYLEREAGEDEHEVGRGEAGEEHADRRGLDVRVARHRGQDERVAHDPQHEGHRVHGQGGTLDGERGLKWNLLVISE